MDCYTCPSVCVSPTTLVHVTVSFTLSTVQSGMTLKLNIKQFLHSHVVTKSLFENTCNHTVLFNTVMYSTPHSDTTAVAAALLDGLHKIRRSAASKHIHVRDQSDVAKRCFLHETLT